MNKLKGLIVFVPCLWIAVVITYAHQGGRIKGSLNMVAMDGASCSSSSTSGHE